MKYDLTRCNNLNFKLGNGTTGFIKIPPEGNCYFYLHDETWDSKSMMQKPRFWICVAPEAFNRYVEENELLIVPRDPETYVDWKVGDMVCSRQRLLVCTVVARLGEITFLEPLEGSVSPYFHTSRGMKECYRLVPTDYEKELLGTKEEDEKKCPFRKGDRVLVRDKDECAWIFEKFDSYEDGYEYPYICERDGYRQCIPFNEKTWMLLGTNNEYKEE